jgi:hypothetical protein
MRARHLTYWIAPQALGLLLYWPGLTAWFQKDDFAWLGLRQAFDEGQSLAWVFFVPLAQGTIRTISERLFFFSLYSMFGLHALPYRLLAFATFGAALALLMLVCEKLTGSRAAAFCSAMLWNANASLSVPMSWTSDYNKLLWSLCLLAMLWCLIRFGETGQPRFYFAHAAIFIAGFFVLELNVVWPAIAVTYSLLYARKIFWRVVPLFLVSGIYTAIHLYVAPLPSSGPYQMHWDAHVFTTLMSYVNWAFGPGWGRIIGIVSSRYRSSLSLLVAVGIIAFLYGRLRERDWRVLLFPAWFLIVLAPLLPLRDHASAEYAAVPSIGLAMLGGWGVASARRGSAIAKLVALAALVSYFGTSIPAGWRTTVSFHDRSRRIETFFNEVRALAPADRTVFLTGLSEEIKVDAVAHRPFRLVGIREVYLLSNGSQLDPSAIVLDASSGHVRAVQ